MRSCLMRRAPPSTREMGTMPSPVATTSLLLLIPICLWESFRAGGGLSFANYRDKVFAALPLLKYLDGTDQDDNELDEDEFERRRAAHEAALGAACAQLLGEHERQQQAMPLREASQSAAHPEECAHREQQQQLRQQLQQQRLQRQRR